MTKFLKCATYIICVLINVLVVLALTFAICWCFDLTITLKQGLGVYFVCMLVGWALKGVVSVEK